MSWDIVLFNSKQKIEMIEDIDPEQFQPFDFCRIFEDHFKEIIKTDNHREIKGKEFSIQYFLDDEPVSNKILNLYGENGLFEIVMLAKNHGWQIYDTGNGQMINLENPSNNGYKNFQSYLRHVLNNE